MTLDPLTIGMLVILAVLIIFMFRSSRKRKQQAAELQQKVVAGADVMTNSGVFGTIVSIDDEDNKIRLEVAPGVVITVHRQTVTRVIDDHTVEDDASQLTDADASTAPELNVDHAISEPAPEFGERIDGAKREKKADDN
ncbi:preprotein translocase subunit YajC [Rathayibacter soli]|uniref:preprotein translocase subunit YajC n=1 Tax=Rathayibacter soli TaxID=3144168 RepID=UPI0027E458DB|nr:preprotein translocase subunit YajC [Glaciibacter superstes]